MKYTSFLFAMIFLISCNPNESATKAWEKNSPTILSGAIQNYNPSSMPSKMTMYYYDGIFKQRSTSVKIDSVGNFSAEFKLPRPQDINLYYRTWLSLIVYPGDSIHLKFDGNQAERQDLLSSLEISGDSKSLNEDFRNFLINDSILNSFYGPIATISPQEFLVHHDSLFKLRNAYISEFLEANPKSDATLKSWLQAEQDIVPITKIVEFPMYYRMYNRGKQDSLGYPDGFFNRVSELNQITDESYVNGKLGTLSNQLLFHYYDKINPNKDRMKSDVQDSLLFEALEKDFKDNPIPMQLAIADRVRADLESMNTSFIDNHMDKLKAIYGTSEFGEAIFEAYNTTKEELANTELPDNVDFVDFSSDQPTDYLAELVEKADGKILYIDHWATWCAPCRSEFEYALPDFKEKYKDSIQFVYFCYSSKKEEWKPLIRKYQLSGMHYFVDDEENKTLREQMTVNGYPTYTIIDENGTIVKSASKYRPSQAMTSQILDSLLQKKARP